MLQFGILVAVLVAFLLVCRWRQVLEIPWHVEAGHKFAIDRNDVIDFLAVRARSVDVDDCSPIYPSRAAGLIHQIPRPAPWNDLLAVLVVIALHVALAAKRCVALAIEFTCTTVQAVRLTDGSHIHGRITVTPVPKAVHVAETAGMHGPVALGDDALLAVLKQISLRVAAPFAMPFQSTLVAAELGPGGFDRLVVAFKAWFKNHRQTGKRSLVVQSAEILGIALLLAFLDGALRRSRKNDISDRLSIVRTAKAFGPKVGVFATVDRALSDLSVHLVKIANLPCFMGSTHHNEALFSR